MTFILCFHQQCTQVSICLHLCQHWLLSVLFILAVFVGVKWYFIVFLTWCWAFSCVYWPFACLLWNLHFSSTDPSLCFGSCSLPSGGGSVWLHAGLPGGVQWTCRGIEVGRRVILCFFPAPPVGCSSWRPQLLFCFYSGNYSFLYPC